MLQWRERRCRRGCRCLSPALVFFLVRFLRAERNFFVAQKRERVPTPRTSCFGINNQHFFSISIKTFIVYSMSFFVVPRPRVKRRVDEARDLFLSSAATT